MGVKDFHELRVYQLAFECAVRIHGMTERFICSQLAIIMADPEKWALTTASKRPSP